MTRNLKMLSLALVAVCAMSAMIASAASAASFTSASYPSTITGEGGLTVSERITLGKTDHFVTIDCNHTTYHGTLSAASSTLTVLPKYSGCTGFGFLESAAKPEGCTYVFHATSTSSSTFDIECPVGQSIKISGGTCEVAIGTQTGLKSVGLANSGGHVNMTPNVSSIAYTSIKDGLFCPLTGTGARTGATYTSGSAITVKGSNGAISVS